jgi:Protein of unknown function (DUF2934)
MRKSHPIAPQPGPPVAPVGVPRRQAPGPIVTPHMPEMPDLIEQVRARAYELYEQRGRRDGFAEQDWLQAEAEILTRIATFPA